MDCSTVNYGVHRFVMYVEPSVQCTTPTLKDLCHNLGDHRKGGVVLKPSSLTQVPGVMVPH